MDLWASLPNANEKYSKHMGNNQASFIRWEIRLAKESKSFSIFSLYLHTNFIMEFPSVTFSVFFRFGSKRWLHSTLWKIIFVSFGCLCYHLVFHINIHSLSVESLAFTFVRVSYHPHKYLYETTFSFFSVARQFYVSINHCTRVDTLACV